MKQHRQVSLPVWTAFVMAHGITEPLGCVHLCAQFIDIARKTLYQYCYFGIKAKLNDTDLLPPEIEPENLRFASILDIGCSRLQSTGISFLSLSSLVSHNSSSRAQLYVLEESICCSGTQCSLQARTAQAWHGANGISKGSGAISVWADRLQTPVWQTGCTPGCTDSTVMFPAVLFEKEFPNVCLTVGEGLYFLLVIDLENYWFIWMQLQIHRTTTALPGASFSFLCRQI